MADFYHFSKYEKHPDSEGAAAEIAKLQETVETWGKAFPKVEAIVGNHDRRVIDRLREAGLPSNVINDTELLNKCIKSPKGWTWHDSITVKHKFGSTLIVHGDRGSACRGVGSTLKKHCMSVVFGHFHSLAHIWFKSTKHELLYEMCVGCGIDDDKLPFGYNQGQVERPILVGSVLVDGYPVQEVMRLDENGRWTGELG